MAVLAARQAHHHLVARLDHREVGDRLAYLPADALGELVLLVVRLAGIALEEDFHEGLEEDGPAAVDGDDLAGDERSAGQEVYRLRDVFRAAGAPKRRGG